MRKTILNGTKRHASEYAGTVDYAVITIRADEFRAVLRFFPPTEVAKGRRTYEISDFKSTTGSLYRAALLRTPEQGHSVAQAATSDAIFDLNPTWIVLVGIGGAVPEYEFTLGDVVVASRIQDFSITAALSTGEVEYDARGAPAHKEVQDFIARLPALESEMSGWGDAGRLGVTRPLTVASDEDVKSHSAQWAEKVERTMKHHFEGNGTLGRKPLAVAETIASGNVLMKDSELLSRWLDSARSIKLVEMEAPGVFEAARSTAGDKPVLVVRGVSDVVGYKRDNAWIPYACATAASAARALLDTEPVPALPKALRSSLSALSREVAYAMRDAIARARIPFERFVQVAAPNNFYTEHWPILRSAPPDDFASVPPRPQRSRVGPVLEALNSHVLWQRCTGIMTPHHLRWIDWMANELKAAAEACEQPLNRHSAKADERLIGGLERLAKSLLFWSEPIYIIAQQGPARLGSNVGGHFETVLLELLHAERVWREVLGADLSD